jgi:putative Holliday junction resolvase
LLVGLPLGPEGDETEMSKAARQFGAQLAARYSLPVEFADERLTSRAAESRFIELRARGELRRKNADQLDAISAQIILENWLQSAHG